MITVFRNYYYLVFCLIWVTITLPAQQTINTNFSTPSLDGEIAPVSILFPRDYDSQNINTYRLFIYLHGCCLNSNLLMVSRIGPAAKKLMADNEIEPAIFVFPNLQIDLEPNFGNRHLYVNSGYYGNYSDVIVEDLLNWLKKDAPLNLGKTIRFERNSMAIGGWSMGADGALNIGLNNSDKFMGIAAHGSVSISLDRQWMDDDLIPKVLAENVKRADGTYNFDPDGNLGGNTSIAFGISAAWLDLDSIGNIQFMLTPYGGLNDDLFRAIRKKADVSTLIKDLGLYSSIQNSPYIFHEWGETERLSVLNTDFVEKRWPGLKISDAYLNSVETKFEGHNITASRAKQGIKWLSDKMDQLTTSVKNHAEHLSYKIYPNPANTDGIHISFDLSYSHEQVQLRFLDVHGKEINLIQPTLSKGINHYQIEISSLSEGVYFFQLIVGDKQAIKKVVIL